MIIPHAYKKGGYDIVEEPKEKTLFEGYSGKDIALFKGPKNWHNWQI